jgi:hypothetical protein
MRAWLTPNRDMLMIVFVAFVLRASLVGWLHDMRGYTGDETEYISLAKKLSEGQPFVDSNGEWATKAPCYPFVLSLCFRLFGASLFVPHLLNVSLGTIAVFLGFGVCRRLCNDRFIALTAAGIMAVYPGLVVYSCLLQSEALYIVLLLLLILAGEALRAHVSVSSAILFGVIAGVANLTRAVLTGFVPLVLFVIGWMHRERLGMMGGKLLLAAVVWLLVLAPWTWRNYKTLDVLVPVSSWGGMSLVLGNNPHATGTWKPKPAFDAWFAEKADANGVQLSSSTEVQRSRLGTHLALEFWRTEPLAATRLAVRKLYMHIVYPITNTDTYIPLQLAAVMADVAVYFFAGIGLLAVVGQRNMYPAYAAIIFFSLMQVVMHCEARYRLPIMPFVAMLSAAGLALLSDTQRRTDFLHSGTNNILASLWCVAVCGLYAFTAWQFFSGTN